LVPNGEVLLDGPIHAIVRRSMSRLRYPRLLALTGALFVVDLFVPDLIPFADEILLGLGTLLLTRLRTRRPPPADEIAEP
jgi:hypothetical protein